MAGMDFGRFDIYRKIPRDLTKGTMSGAGLSFFGVFFLTVLFIFELNSYLTGGITTDVIMDPSTDERIRVSFNISLPKIPCQFASVDVQDVLKTRKHNITVNIQKWRIDYDAGLRIAQASDKVAAPKYGQASADHDPDGRKSAELHNAEQFEAFVKGHDIALVNFYAPWCIWCKRLHPVWEETAGLVSNKYMQKVQFAKLDCTKPVNQEVCKNNHITAFPTIITYRNHKDHSHEHYHGDRTVGAFTSHVDAVWADQVKKGEAHALDAPKPEAPKEAQTPEAAGPTKGTFARAEGCQISGFLDVNKVPGSLFFTVESGGHSFDAARINMSHVVHQLSYGTVLTPAQVARVPEPTAKALNRLEGKGYFSTMLNASYEHYVKVVGSKFFFSNGEAVDTYTYTTNSHQYQDNATIAAAKFTYDLSPMSIVVTETREPFYKFLTSICAIIGGVFTVIGLIDSMVYHSMRTLKKKIALGKTN